MIAFVLGIFRFAWSPNVDPLGDAKLNNAPAVVAATPSPTPQPTQLVVHDFAPRPVGGRCVNGFVRLPVEFINDLPLKGNLLGDMRFVQSDGHFWVWTTPAGSIAPSWIDP
jgi:hypothetical protein